MLMFGWRWIVVLLLGLVFARRSGPILMIVLQLAGAFLAIRAGKVAWRAGSWRVSGPRETYWRGRRIDLPATPSRDSDSILPDQARSATWFTPALRAQWAQQ